MIPSTRTTTRTKPRAAAILFMALAFSIIFTSATTVTAQDTQPDSGEPQNPYNDLSKVPDNYPLPPEAVPMFAGVMAHLQQLRGRDFIHTNIALRKIPAKKYEQRIRREVNALYPPDRHHDIVQGLARLGMIDPDTNLAEQTITARMGQSAVVYNTSNDRMLVIMKQIPFNYLTSIAPYRLARVLQDQHFDVDGILKSLKTQHESQPRPDDSVLAAHFLLDGEPTYLQFKWNIIQAGDADPMTEQTEDETLKTLSSVAGTQITLMTRPTLRYYATLIDKGREEPILKAMFEMGDLSGYVINPIYVAQNKGAYFVSFLKRIGGWEDVERAYTELPTSTEQVLHPEKLFYEPDLPTPIQLPQFQTLISENWSLVDSAIHGEYYLFNLLRRWQFDRFDSRIATTGWDGDIYQAWKSPAETYAIIIASTWDSEKDASEFYTGYLRLLGQKYPNAIADTSSSTTRYSYTCGDPALQHGWLILRGNEVFIIEGLPKDLGTKVLAELEAMEIVGVE